MGRVLKISLKAINELLVVIIHNLDYQMQGQAQSCNYFQFSLLCIPNMEE